MNFPPNSALAAEHEDNLRLRRSEQALAAYIEKENELRRELARAVQSTKSAQEKHAELFAQCEARACKRRELGQIVNSID